MRIAHSQSISSARTHELNESIFHLLRNQHTTFWIRVVLRVPGEPTNSFDIKGVSFFSILAETLSYNAICWERQPLQLVFHNEAIRSKHSSYKIHFPVSAPSSEIHCRMSGGYWKLRLLQPSHPGQTLPPHPSLTHSLLPGLQWQDQCNISCHWCTRRWRHKLG